MSNPKKQTAKEFLESVGVLAETHLAYYRACLGAGATPEEAVCLTMAYMRSLFFEARERQKEEMED